MTLTRRKFLQRSIAAATTLVGAAKLLGAQADLAWHDVTPRALKDAAGRTSRDNVTSTDCRPTPTASCAHRSGI